LRNCNSVRPKGEKKGLKTVSRRVGFEAGSGRESWGGEGIDGKTGKISLVSFWDGVLASTQTQGERG